MDAHTRFLRKLAGKVAVTVGAPRAYRMGRELVLGHR
jgi:hypothetical protein